MITVLVCVAVPVFLTAFVVGIFKVQQWGRGESTHVFGDEVPPERRLKSVANEGAPLPSPVASGSLLEVESAERALKEDLEEWVENHRL